MCIISASVPTNPLLLRFFVLYMPQLIEAGKVYKALPPLYSFMNGKKINYNQLRKRAKTTDCHIFIHNYLIEDITEMQLNYEDYYHKRLMKSAIVNMALMMLSDELSDMDDQDKIKFLNELSSEYKGRYN